MTQCINNQQIKSIVSQNNLVVKEFLSTSSEMHQKNQKSIKNNLNKNAEAVSPIFFL